MSGAAAEAGARPHVLVVEDDELVAAMVRDALDYAGFEVTAVVAAEDAISLAVMDVPFDLVFTDIDLAGPIDGWELGEAMREMRGDVPLVFACAEDADVTAAARFGHAAFLPKPYSPIALCATIRERLAPARRKPDIAPAPAQESEAEVVRLDDWRARRAAAGRHGADAA
jgi:DNA-binding response OmpR family regulator